MPPSTPPSSYVYVIGSPTGGPVKIGTARDPFQRLKGIQTGNPEQLKVLWSTAGGRILEQRLHAKFKAYRRAGEWFDFGDLNAVETISAAVPGQRDRAAIPVGPRTPLQPPSKPRPREMPTGLSYLRAWLVTFQWPLMVMAGAALYPHKTGAAISFLLLLAEHSAQRASHATAIQIIAAVAVYFGLRALAADIRRCVVAARRMLRAAILRNLPAEPELVVRRSPRTGDSMPARPDALDLAAVLARITARST